MCLILFYWSNAETLLTVSVSDVASTADLIFIIAYHCCPQQQDKGLESVSIIRIIFHLIFQKLITLTYYTINWNLRDLTNNVNKWKKIKYFEANNKSFYSFVCFFHSVQVLQTCASSPEWALTSLWEDPCPEQTPGTQ